MPAVTRSRRLVSVLSWLALCASILPARLGADTVAFVVGVENYQVSVLNELKYVAEDAYEIFEALKKVNVDFDQGRSKVLLADRKAMGPLPPGSKRQLRREEIQDALEDFLEGVRSSDRVILYFGGHGDVRSKAEGSGVSFLPSDFEAAGYKRPIPIKSIEDELKLRLSGKTNLEVVVLANMCHAGALAPGEGRLREYTEAEFWEAQEQFKAGVEKFAYLPAAPPDASAFEHEDWGGSEFVHHLLSGLRGENAPGGRITSGSLLKHLQQKMTTPPQPKKFDPGIEIGRLHHLEAEYRYLMGVATGAIAIEDMHKEHFLELANRHFRRAAEASTGDRYGASRLGVAQTELLRGDPAGAARQLRILRRNRAGTTHPSLHAGLDELLEDLGPEDDQPGSFVAVLCGGHFRETLVDQMLAEQEHWDTSLSEIPGMVEVKKWFVEVGEVVGQLPEIEAVVEDWAQQEKAENLIFIYHGVGGTNPPASGFPDASQSTDSAPIETAWLWRLAERWPGAVTLVYDAPFGGVLKQRLPQDLRDRVSLWLAASQLDGMTFSIPEGQREDRLSTAIKGGLTEERLDSLRQAQKAYAPSYTVSEEFIVGTTEWIGPRVWPMWRKELQWHNVLTRQTLGWVDWLTRLANGDLLMLPDDATMTRVERVLEARELAATGLWTEAAEQLAETNAHWEPPFRRGTLYEAVGDPDRAGEAYAVAASEVRATLDAARASDHRFPKLAVKELEGLQKLIERRQDQRAAARPTVHVVAAAVEEYASALVPDLQRARDDVDSWIALMSELLGSNRIVPYRPAGDLRAHLLAEVQRAVAASQSHDLLILIFSGRGATTDGQPCLAMDSDDGSALDCLPLGEMLEAAGQRDMVVVLDAQFSPNPEGESHPLFKHAFPWRGEAGGAPLAADLPRSIPPRHLVVWWDGRLPEEHKAAERDLHIPSTVFSRALQAVLKEGHRGTYESWIREAQARARQRQGSIRGASPWPSGRLRISGPKHRLLFSSGAGADALPSLLRQEDRLYAILRLATSLYLEERKESKDALDQLTYASILIASGDLDRRRPAGFDRAHETQYVTANGVLKELKDRRSELEEKGLYRQYLSLHSHVLARGLNTPDDALNLLLKQSSEYLLDPAILDDLVAITRQAVQVSAETKVNNVEEELRKRIEQAPDRAAELEGRIDQIRGLLSAGNPADRR